MTKEEYVSSMELLGHIVSSIVATEARIQEVELDKHENKEERLKQLSETVAALKRTAMEMLNP